MRYNANQKGANIDYQLIRDMHALDPLFSNP